MKIAITGGSGFIGTHLVNFLKKEHDILILDRESSKIHDVDFIECDMLESEKISNALKTLTRSSKALIWGLRTFENF